VGNTQHNKKAHPDGRVYGYDDRITESVRSKECKKGIRQSAVSLSLGGSIPPTRTNQNRVNMNPNKYPNLKETVQDFVEIYETQGEYKCLEIFAKYILEDVLPYADLKDGEAFEYVSTLLTCVQLRLELNQLEDRSDYNAPRIEEIENQLNK